MRLKITILRNQMPIVIGWSFFPLAPTDLICYACGILRINFVKLVVGILIGEGTICGVYISSAIACYVFSICGS